MVLTIMSVQDVREFNNKMIKLKSTGEEMKAPYLYLD